MNTDQIKEQMQKYAGLKAQITSLEDQIDILKPEIEVAITTLNPDDYIVETDFGTFSLVQKRKYTYSEEVKMLEKRIKELKTQAEQDGSATYEINPYVLFKSKTIN